MNTIMNHNNWRSILDIRVSDPQLNIWIGHLIRSHNYKYPLEWYLNKSDFEIKFMYNDMIKYFCKHGTYKNYRRSVRNAKKNPRSSKNDNNEKTN